MLWWLVGCDLGGGDTGLFFFDSGGFFSLCGETVESVNPEDGEVDVWWDTPFTITGGERLADATIETRFAGETRYESGQLTFTPDEAWPPATSVDLLVSACDRGVALRFVTVGAQAPVDAAALDGGAWTLGDPEDTIGTLTVLDRLYGLTLPTVAIVGDTVVLDGGAADCATWNGRWPLEWVNDSAIRIPTEQLTVAVGSATVDVIVDSFFLDFSPDTLAPAGVGLRGRISADALAAATNRSESGICIDMNGFSLPCTPCEEGRCIDLDVSVLIGSPTDATATQSAADQCG